MSGHAAEPGCPLRHIVATSLYGRLPLAEILPEVRRLGVDVVDVWPGPHGRQREEISELGVAAARSLFERHRLRVGIYSCYNPGLAASGPWLEQLRALGGDLLVSYSGGAAGISGKALKAALAELVRSWKPVIDRAADLGVRLAVENHSGSTVSSPDSIRWLLEATPPGTVGLALAPYHLPQDPSLIAALIGDAGPRLFHFYAWEHGKGSNGPQPREDELRQLPGRGSLDWDPVLKGLKRAGYAGWTSVFMHPFPRGVAIQPTADGVTRTLRQAMDWLDARAALA